MTLKEIEYVKLESGSTGS